MPLEEQEIGFIKFSGKAVESGIIDAASAGTALLGLDEAIRYFNEKQSPEFARINYQIPVRTTEGSWVAWVLGVVGAGASIFALSYLKKAGEKMAENDFKDIGIKDIIGKSLDALQTLVKLVKHTKKIKNWDTENISWRNNNSEVGIPNSENELFYLPVEYFEWYQKLPSNFISKITAGVELDRSLSIGIKRQENYEEVTIEVQEKHYFSQALDPEEEEYLFPELKHGDSVKLEGKLTRGNESSNSIGLEYRGHILNCIPETGSIRKYKAALFLHCVVTGSICRFSKQRMVVEKRPTIIVHSIIPLEEDDQYDLF